MIIVGDHQLKGAVVVNHIRVRGGHLEMTDVQMRHGAKVILLSASAKVTVHKTAVGYPVLVEWAV